MLVVDGCHCEKTSLNGTYIVSFPSIWRSLEGDKGWSNRDLLVEFCQGTTLEKPAITSPDMPPKVFKSASSRILELLICGRIH